ncbi:hypothetical protein HU200_047655 [Digitaria exilis]|uniref:Uncharacterized protein n=1 Tax=Digitaria exilis TaxID=1010633 RepID=A0A835B2W4_9POAL|nr:hypothetical protein HU200_047655 [Digitaria exilis]
MLASSLVFSWILYGGNGDDSLDSDSILLTHIQRDSYIGSWCIWTHRNSIIFMEGFCLLIDGNVLSRKSLVCCCIRPSRS